MEAGKGQIKLVSRGGNNGKNASNNNNGKDSYIGAGINKRECQTDPPDFSIEGEEYRDEMENIVLWTRNHSVSYLVKWSWFVWAGMFFVEMLGTCFFMFFQLSANFVFPDGVGTERRSLIIGAAAFLVKITAGRWTSAHLDPIRSIGTTLSFIFTRGRRTNTGGVWMELLKLPLFIIAQWIGVMLAQTFLGLWTDTDIMTSDCSLALITPAVCNVYPIRDVGVTVHSLRWMEALGAMIIYGMFVWGERFFAWRYPGILFSALFYGGGHYIVHMLFSTASGGSFNFWYWAQTAWFSNIDDPNNASYVWPSIVGIFIVVIIDIVVYYIIDVLGKRNNKPGDGDEYEDKLL